MSDVEETIAAAARRVAAGVGANAPEGWRELRLATSHTLSAASFVLEALMPDGGWHRFSSNFSDDLFDGSSELRSASYVPGRGTWFLLRMHVDARGAMTYELDHDADPTPVKKFTPDSYVQDLAHYLRDETHRPAWLEETVAEAERREARNAAARARRAERTAARRAQREAGAQRRTTTTGEQP